MIDSPWKRLIFILSTVVFVFAALFSEHFVFTRLDHDCSGDHCSTCLQIRIARGLLENLRRTGVIVSFSIVDLITAAVKNQALFCAFPATPVLLKVKSST